MKPVIKELTPEQKMINYLRQSLETQKVRHREILKEKDAWLRERSQEYQNIESALMMQLRVLRKHNEILRDRVEKFYYEEVRPEGGTEGLPIETEGSLPRDRRPEDSH